MRLRVFTVCTGFLMLVSATGGVFSQTNGSGQAPVTRCLSQPVEAPVRGVLASDGNNLYIGTANGALTSYGTRDLGIAWRLELGGEFVSEIVVIGNGLLVATNSVGGGSGASDGTTVRLIAKDSGVTAWSVRLPYSEQYHLGRLNGGIAAVSRQGAVTLLDSGSGGVRWQTASQGTLAVRPSFSLGRVAFGTVDKQIIVISAHDGELLHKVPTDIVLTSIAFSRNDGILTGDERGNVTLLGAQNNKPVWKFKSGAAVSSVTDTEEGVLITSLDNFVYLISDYNGDVVWKRRLPGRLVEGGLRLNGHVIVLIYGENTGYVLDLENGKVADVVASSDKYLISRSPIQLRDKTFAVSTINSIETYAIGGCESNGLATRRSP